LLGRWGLREEAGEVPAGTEGRGRLLRRRIMRGERFGLLVMGAFLEECICEPEM